MPALTTSGVCAALAWALLEASATTAPAPAPPPAAEEAPPPEVSLRMKSELTLEARAFPSDGRSDTRDSNAALAGRFELIRSHGDFTERLRLFGRKDALDSGREIAVVEEALVQYRMGRFELRAGAELLNWSATEAFHPADVMNSRNFDSNLENLDKMGEPAVALSTRVGQGTLDVWYLPVHVEPELPSRRSRLNIAPPGWTVGEPIWVDRDGGVDGNDFANQWAVRLAQNVGPADVTFHVLQQIDRHQPAIFAQPEEAVARPIFLPVTQIGGTVQAVHESWVFKTEWAHRRFGELEASKSPFGPAGQPDHTQVAFGLEYGLAYANGQDSTFLLEGQSIFGAGKETRAELHSFQRDVLVGYRHAFNDIYSRDLTASVIADVERGRELLFNLIYSQRLTDVYSVRVNLRVIDAPAQGDFPVGLERFDKADQIQVSLTRHF